MVALTLSPSAAETTRWVLGFLVPILVAAITKTSWSSALKSTINAVLAAGVVLLTALADTRGANFDVYVRQFIQTAVVSFASYYGFWKPQGVARKVSRATDRLVS